MRAQVLPRLAAMGCAVVLATAPVAQAALLAAVAPAGAAVAPNSSQPVQVFPVAGSQAISPESQISFRGVPAAPTIRVVGSVTGAHPGRWLTHGDQRGVSFVPDRGFTAGETVTVTTPLSIAGAEGGTFRYMVARPGAVPAGSVPSLYLPSPARAAAQQPAAAGTPRPYRSRPDLRPPPITINTSTGRSAPGLLFASSGVPTSVADAGVLIYEDRGQPVWFKTLPPNGLGTLTRISYRGRDAVTWFEGYSPWQGGFKGSWIVADSTYSKIGEVAAGNGYVADGHELEVDSQGTRALLDVYNPVAMDLSRYGGSASATVLEAVVQEIDLATGAVTFEWHSLDQVPVDDTYESLQAPAGGGQQVVDYFHPNSPAYDSDGSILVNGRHISATVKLDRTAIGGSGVRWRLGGKHSDFTFQAPDGSSDPSYAPSYPHDARRRPDGTLSVYDNGVQRTPRYGRGIAWRLDEAAHTARAVRVWDHGKTLFGLIVGSNRLQPNGDQLVSFGSSGDATEYDATGAPVWESRLSAGNGQPADQAWSYRTLRFNGWHGKPAEPPALAVDGSGTAVTAYASWNGATDVARWALLAGPDAGALRTVATAACTGFET